VNEAGRDNKRPEEKKICRKIVGELSCMVSVMVKEVGRSKKVIN
jgi:hypothetical protein